MWSAAADSDDCEICTCSRATKTSCDANERCNARGRCNKHSCMNKENFENQLKHETEISLYASANPARTAYCCGPLHSNCLNSFEEDACPGLEDYDPNSHDSGYGQSYQDKMGTDDEFFKFAQAKQNCENDKENAIPLSHHSSIGSVIDEEFMIDLIDIVDNENTQLPSTSYSALMKDALENPSSIKKDSIVKRPLFGRSLSLNIEKITSTSTKARNCLFKEITHINENINQKSFKRPDPPANIQGSISNKRSKFEIENLKPQKLLQRSISVTEESIMCSVERSSKNPDLIGDFSKPFILPLVPGRHQDLKSITPMTLAKLMRGDFDSLIESYKVIDCRYPYEFKGGHIEGALNLYTKEQIKELVESKCSSAAVDAIGCKRHILIFHCEFSSERGPNLSRLLRKLDRTRNNSAYPALHFPEIYLLDGGYKNFFENFENLCHPTSYMPMLHPAHKNELRYFHAKSKTWDADNKSSSKSSKLSVLKRLDFL